MQSEFRRVCFACLSPSVKHVCPGRVSIGVLCEAGSYRRIRREHGDTGLFGLQGIESLRALLGSFQASCACLGLQWMYIQGLDELATGLDRRTFSVALEKILLADALGGQRYAREAQRGAVTSSNAWQEMKSSARPTSSDARLAHEMTCWTSFG